MFKKTVNKLFESLFSGSTKSGKKKGSGAQGFALYEYLRDDGSFDYEKYRRVQIDGNKRKIHRVWAREENIIFLSNYIKDTIGQPRFGICHGSRRGKEQEWFRNQLNCEVIGTEISDTAHQFLHTIQWDFHQVKPEWVNACDFIYSNSFDHTYDPETCLNAWMSCIRTGGLCIIEHTSSHEALQANELDPFGVDITFMPYLIVMWGKGRYGIREIMDTPSMRKKVAESKFIVIQKF